MRGARCAVRGARCRMQAVRRGVQWRYSRVGHLPCTYTTHILCSWPMHICICSWRACCHIWIRLAARAPLWNWWDILLSALAFHRWYSLISITRVK